MSDKLKPGQDETAYQQRKEHHKKIKHRILKKELTFVGLIIIILLILTFLTYLFFRAGNLNP